MSRRRRVLGGGGADFDSDAEVLQTDVMRFMALLGFLLVGIFALVQALPVSPVDQSPALEERARLERELLALQRHVADQRDRLQRLLQSVAAAQAMREELERDARQVRSELTRVRTTAEHLATEVEARKESLEALEQRLDRGRESLSRTRRELERERAELTTLESELNRAEQRAAQAAQAPPTPAPSPPEQSASEPARQAGKVPQRGVSISFASDRAFHRLVSEQRVQFYAVIGQRSWKADPLGRVINFRAGAPPGQFHEMAPETVPDRYRRSLRAVVSAADGRDIVWATVLPQAMVAEIRRRVSGLRGAEVVIQADGSLRVDDAGSG